MPLTLEFVWTAQDFEDLLADDLADKSSAFDELLYEKLSDPDFDVWSYLESWKGGKTCSTSCSSGQQLD